MLKDRGLMHSLRRMGLRLLFVVCVLSPVISMAVANASFFTPNSSLQNSPFPADTLEDQCARWRIQKTAPMQVADLDSSALDLKRPDNIRQTVEYDDSANVYYVGTKIGDSYLNAPVLMTPEEYAKWTEKRALREFFRKKDAENVQTGGKEKFSFADMHFDLGPAEKIFREPEEHRQPLAAHP